MSAEFSEQIQSLLYGKLEVEFVDPTYIEQLEIVRALTANPHAYSRLRIKGSKHPWITRLLTGFELAAQAAQTAEQAAVQAAAQCPPFSR
jgi:hypothetical protein